MRRRVAITGAGVVCSAGNSADQVWAALREGRSAIGTLDQEWAREGKCHVAAAARGVSQIARPSAYRIAWFGLTGHWAEPRA